MLDAFLQHLPSLPAFSILAIVACIGGVMRGFSGFGAGLLIAPIYAIIMTPTDVVVIILLLNLITTLPMLREAMRDAPWPMIWQISIPAFLGIPLGLAMLHMIDPDIMRKTVAAIVSLVAVFMLAGWVYKGRRNKLTDSVAGLASGYMTAIGGIGGPPLVLYLLSDRDLSQVAFRAFCLIFFMFVQFFTLGPLAVTGAITAGQLSLCAALLPPYILANLVGAALHRRTGPQHQALVRRLCLLFLLAVGIVAFLI